MAQHCTLQIDKRNGPLPVGGTRSPSGLQNLQPAHTSQSVDTPAYYVRTTTSSSTTHWESMGASEAPTRIVSLLAKHPLDGRLQTVLYFNYFSSFQQCSTKQISVFHFVQIEVQQNRFLHSIWDPLQASKSSESALRTQKASTASE